MFVSKEQIDIAASELWKFVESDKDWADVPENSREKINIVYMATKIMEAVSTHPLAIKTIFLQNVYAEYCEAQKNWPGNHLKGYVCSQEFGELIKAMMKEPAANVYKEAVQLAAAAMQCALLGDDALDETRRQRNLDPLP